MRHNPSDLVTSAKGKVALAASEGLVPAVYLDSVGVDTFGVGVTAGAIGAEGMAKLPVAMPDDVEQWIDYALDLFPKVAANYEKYVRRNVRVDLYQHEFDALVHFVYNVGEPNFKRSKLLRNLNSGDYVTAGDSGFHGWMKPPELRTRRDKESRMFLDGHYGSDRVPIYKTDGKKNLRGVYRTIPHSEALAMMGGEDEQDVVDVPEFMRRSDPAQIQQRPRVPNPPAPLAHGPAVENLIADSERGGASSNSNIVSIILGLVGGGGSLMTYLEQMDAKMVAMIVGGVVVLGALYILSSRHRKTKKGRNARDETNASLIRETFKDLNIGGDDLRRVIEALKSR